MQTGHHLASNAASSFSAVPHSLSDPPRLQISGLQLLPGELLPPSSKLFVAFVSRKRETVDISNMDD